MNFQRGRGREEPEINLVPMIDVLLVIIIFLMLTTTYSKFSGLEINLPTAEAGKQVEQPNEIDVAVGAAARRSTHAAGDSRGARWYCVSCAKMVSAARASNVGAGAGCAAARPALRIRRAGLPRRAPPR